MQNSQFPQPQLDGRTKEAKAAAQKVQEVEMAEFQSAARFPTGTEISLHIENKHKKLSAHMDGDWLVVDCPDWKVTVKIPSTQLKMVWLKK